MLPMAEHRFCARHMYVNWKKNGRHNGEELKQAFWSITKAPNERVYNQRLEALRGWNATAAEDIEKSPIRQYCRAFLSADERCDMIDNNMCEAFNGTLLKARKLPVISRKLNSSRRPFLNSNRCFPSEFSPSETLNNSNVSITTSRNSTKLRSSLSLKFLNIFGPGT
ncbi:hypothetical protein COLO4_33224 [Corchorus olitorius]|uniref:MULE transposase domain-containing protein n=1 Tax=Corchorus olitorius TaxID=93759 RepID=A0A1R3GVK0_9ROSI|nr:hypothetical protein COLO4_33224 [Corchorus olitorius]